MFLTKELLKETKEKITLLQNRLSKLETERLNDLDKLLYKIIDNKNIMNESYWDVELTEDFVILISDEHSYILKIMKQLSESQMRFTLTQNESNDIFIKYFPDNEVSKEHIRIMFKYDYALEYFEKNDIKISSIDNESLDCLKELLATYKRENDVIHNLVQDPIVTKPCNLLTDENYKSQAELANDLLEDANDLLKGAK